MDQRAKSPASPEPRRREHLELRGTVQARTNSLRAVWNMGRDLASYVVFALAGNPPQLSVIITSAALGLLLDLLPARPAWRLRLE